MDERTAVGVMLVDDNAMMSEAFARLLTTMPGIRWMGSFESVDRLMDTIVARASGIDTAPLPDVVLMDVDIPGQDTFGMVAALAASYPQVRVVMFSGHVRPDYVEKAIQAGSLGYICKDDRPAQIVEAIRAVAKGEFVLSPAVAWLSK